MTARKLSSATIDRFIGIISKRFKAQVGPHEAMLVPSLQDALLARMVLDMAGSWENGDEIAASSVHELYVACKRAIFGKGAFDSLPRLLILDPPERSTLMTTPLSHEPPASSIVNLLAAAWKAERPQDGSRIDRAVALVANVTPVHEDLFQVEGVGDTYTVTVDREHRVSTCTCPDHVRSNDRCKHIYAAALFDKGKARTR